MYSTHRGAHSTALFKPLDSLVEIAYAEQYVVQVSGHTRDFMLFGGSQPGRGQSHGRQAEKVPTSEIHGHDYAPQGQNLAAPNTMRASGLSLHHALQHLKKFWKRNPRRIRSMNHALAFCAQRCHGKRHGNPVIAA